MEIQREIKKLAFNHLKNYPHHKKKYEYIILNYEFIHRDIKAKIILNYSFPVGRKSSRSGVNIYHIEGCQYLMPKFLMKTYLKLIITTKFIIEVIQYII